MSRLGLQKRIMLYVAVGLVGMFVAVYWLGTRSIETATEAAFEERLAIATTLAGALSNEFDHAIQDAVEETHALDGGVSLAEAAGAAREAYEHLSETDDFLFFDIASVQISSLSGVAAVAGPEDLLANSTRTLPEVVTIAAGGHSGMRIFWDDAGTPGGFATLTMPLTTAEGVRWGQVVVKTIAVYSPDPFVPFGQTSLSGEAGDPVLDLPSVAQYSLEVVSSSGKALLSIGSTTIPGDISPHFSALVDSIASSPGGVMVHTGPGGDHVMAAVPVPRSDLLLILLQEENVALALENDFRAKISVYGGIGMVAALLVAWFTSRHVVRSAEELTVAARRMAAGDLESPIATHAQDEIGELSESVESMRRQLSRAASERDRSRRDLESRVVDRTRQLREALRQAITGQEGERQRLARDLHDVVAQELIILTRGIDGIRRRSVEQNDPDRAELEYLEGLARSTLDTVRRFSRDLRPSVLDDLGLVPALRWISADTSSRIDAEVTVAEPGPLPDLGADTALALFRITQESLRNIERHAQAGRVGIAVGVESGLIKLTVTDDGRGFDTTGGIEELTRAGHLGIQGMKERAELVGGELIITSEIGRGTVIQATVPPEPASDHGSVNSEERSLVADIDEPAPHGGNDGLSA